VQPLTGAIKNYAWGSRTALAELAGRPVPSELPEAELWLGTHPAGPSQVTATGRSLAEHIADDPARHLGDRTLSRFGAQLPYLLKLIAVAEPLSLQAHPGAADAIDGYRCGTYPDPWPKPELVCALTPFTALAGFHPAEESAGLLTALNVPISTDAAALIREGRTVDALRLLLEHPEDTHAAVTAAATLSGPDHRLTTTLAERHPGDPGCLAPLLLRRHVLAPTEALFLGPGVLHCYLNGLAVEVMAASDNVVRAGLTRKQRNVPELLTILDPAAVPQPSRPDSAGIYPAPCPYFRLRRLTVAGHEELEAGSPKILLCVEGSLEPDLRPGDAAFISASERFTLAGRGVAFLAEPDDPDKEVGA
jgi:mannose-6-phosphate isomerase